MLTPLQVVRQSQRNGKSAQEACKYVIARSAREWKRYEGNDYRDDITVIVVYVPALLARLRAELTSASHAAAPAS